MAFPRRPKKYLKGPAVQDVMEAVYQIMNDQYLIWRNKPMHPAVLRNWSLTMLSIQCRWGHLHFAKINPEYIPSASETEE